jgi:predicted dienelactone hydrolase
LIRSASASSASRPAASRRWSQSAASRTCHSGVPIAPRILTIGGCRTARETGTRPLVPRATFVHDPRIAAAVVTAPLGALFTPEGLAGIKAPIQLWRGEVDEIVPHPRHAQNVYDGLTTNPEYHVVPNAGHFAFLAPCTPALAKVAPEGCRDPAGFDRAAFHREFNSAVVAFFNAKLHPQRATRLEPGFHRAN